MSAPELLDIKQAAALLQVSQASLRRWTDAGKLPCFRLGGRRERRFLRADLLAFLEASPAQVQVAASGHLCGLYGSNLGRSRQAVDFLADRGAAGDVCFLVMARDDCQRVLAQLERRRPSLRADMAAGRFVVSEYADLDGAQLDVWESQCSAALEAGARALHVVGDVSSGAVSQRRTFEEVLAYEAEFERSIAQRFPLTTLCQYDARSLSGWEAARLFRAHSDAFRYPVEHLVS